MSDYLQKGDVGFKKPKVCNHLVLLYIYQFVIPDQEEAANETGGGRLEYPFS
jgi:hypothetical protein